MIGKKTYRTEKISYIKIVNKHYEQSNCIL